MLRCRVKKILGLFSSVRTGLGYYLLTIASLTTDGFAAKFSNQFIEFELPTQWSCILEGAEWICQSSQPEKRKEAIIILAAKLRGEQDSLDQYVQHLKNPKTFITGQNKTLKSEVKWAKTTQNNGHDWVDGLHFESELPGFYTRYMATIKEDIGVLLTFSVSKEKYSNYLSEIDALIKTLRVFRKPGGINAGSSSSNLFARTQLPSAISETTVFGQAGSESPQDAKPKKPQGGDDMTLLLVLGGAVVVFIIIRQRKK